MKISLFIACYNDTFFPDTGKAVVAILERLGHTVEFPAAQTCCGQLHFNSGYWNEVLPLVENFCNTFLDAEVICIPSASCVAMLKEHYPRVAAEAADKKLQAQVEEILPRVYELTELLVDKLGITDVGASFPHSVTLHTSCHSLRSLEIGDRPTQLLSAVKGLQLVALPLSDECCGFGGTFSVKNADVSAAMLNDKIACILGTNGSVCTAVDNSCLMQIAGGLSRAGSSTRCIHLAEILASVNSIQEQK